MDVSSLPILCSIPFSIGLFGIIIVSYFFVRLVDSFFIRHFNESFILSEPCFYISNPNESVTLFSFFPEYIFKQLPFRSCYSNTTICYVCAEPIDQYIVLPCHHHIHAQCLKAWIQFSMTCPLCRATIE